MMRLVPFHRGNGTGGTHGTSFSNYTEYRYVTERIQAGFLVPLVPLVQLIPWNGTEQGRWSGPIDTAAPRPLQEKDAGAGHYGVQFEGEADGDGKGREDHLRGLPGTDDGAGVERGLPGAGDLGGVATVKNNGQGAEDPRYRDGAAEPKHHRTAGLVDGAAAAERPAGFRFHRAGRGHRHLHQPTGPDGKDG